MKVPFPPRYVSVKPVFYPIQTNFECFMLTDTTNGCSGSVCKRGLTDVQTSYLRWFNTWGCLSGEERRNTALPGFSASSPGFHFLPWPHSLLFSICLSQVSGTLVLALWQMHQHIHEMTPQQVTLAFEESLIVTPHTCCSTAPITVRERKIKKDLELFLGVRDVLADVWDSLENVIWLQQRTAKGWFSPGRCFSLMQLFEKFQDIWIEYDT